MCHNWIREPFYGGVEYVCSICGLHVSEEYSPEETEVTSGAYFVLGAEMDRLDKDAPCLKRMEAMIKEREYEMLLLDMRAMCYNAPGYTVAGAVENAINGAINGGYDGDFHAVY
jgi:hypothetical protein